MAIELLAPAGGPAAFKAALAAGADAIYCGFTDALNARRFAEGFNEKSFAASAREAHLAGARVFVTLNVVVKHDEMQGALELAREAYLAGADALIIQDWGLMYEVKRLFPQMEVHVSTQANVHDARGVLWSRSAMGAERVTLSRELSLDEIASCAATGVDVECFGHGAICFCYSGICHMSSYFGGRSANRGLCAQPCRLPHELIDANGELVAPAANERLLCPKDLRSLEHLDAYVASGVASLKIEGRMKSPDYVHSVVAAYRGALDDALAERLPALGEDARRNRLLARAFNRGFTSAYLEGRSGNEMMSYERSNNRGELVGEVASSRALEDEVTVHPRKDGKTRLRRHSRAELALRLTEPVGEKDLLEIRPTDDPSQFFTTLVPHAAQAGETLTVIGVRTAPAGSLVRVIRSQEALDAASAAESAEHPRKRAVHVCVRARKGEPFSVELSTLDGIAASASGFTVEAARTKAVTREELIEHVGRMGATAFAPVSFEVELDEGVGMGFSAVHAVRKDAVLALERALLAPYEARRTESLSIGGLESLRAEKAEELQVCALVASPEAAVAAQAAGAQRIYAPGDALLEDAWPEGVIPVLDEVCREMDHERIDGLVREGAPCAVGNVSELALAAERHALPEIRSCIPVHNSSAAKALVAAGAAAIWLSPELSLAEIASFAPLVQVPVGIAVTGRQRLMTSEHCVLAASGRCIDDCRACGLRSQELFLRNIDGHVLPVKTDVHGRSRIYAAKSLDIRPQMADLIQAGVSRFLVDASLLGADECAREVAAAVRALAAAKAGRRQAPREEGSTSGHLFAPIG